MLITEDPKALSGTIWGIFITYKHAMIQRVISNRSVVTLNVVIFLRDTPLDKQELNTF